MPRGAPSPLVLSDPMRVALVGGELVANRLGAARPAPDPPRRPDAARRVRGAARPRDRRQPAHRPGDDVPASRAQRSGGPRAGAGRDPLRSRRAHRRSCLQPVAARSRGSGHRPGRAPPGGPADAGRRARASGARVGAWQGGGSEGHARAGAGARVPGVAASRSPASHPHLRQRRGVAAQARRGLVERPDGDSARPSRAERQPRASDLRRVPRTPAPCGARLPARPAPGGDPHRLLADGRGLGGRADGGGLEAPGGAGPARGRRAQHRGERIALASIIRAIGTIRRVTVVTSAWHFRTPYFFAPYRLFGLRLLFRLTAHGNSPRMLQHEFRELGAARRERRQAMAEMRLPPEPAR